MVVNRPSMGCHMNRLDPQQSRKQNVSRSSLQYCGNLIIDSTFDGNYIQWKDQQERKEIEAPSICFNWFSIGSFAYVIIGDFSTTSTSKLVNSTLDVECCARSKSITPRPGHTSSISQLNMSRHHQSLKSSEHKCGILLGSPCNVMRY